MSESSTQASVRSLAEQPADDSPAAPLFVWLVIQLLALSLGVFGVPLAARVVQPEQFALHLMLVTQVVAAAMLFPLILRDESTSAMAILAIAPFIQLTSYLSAIPLASASLAGAYVALWMTTLAMCRPMLRMQRNEMLAVACALALSVGGGLVWYLHTELRGAGQVNWSVGAFCGPVAGVIAQLHAPTGAALTAWVFPLIILTTVSIARIAIRATRDR